VIFMPPKKMRLLMAASFISGDLALPKRIEKIAPFFDPKPGSVVRVDKEQTKDFGPKDKEQGRLYGWIKVSPPPGYCFTVTRDLDRQDIEVCKPTSLKWFLYDIDQHRGTLAWTIRTGPDDFGTILKWQTPYRIAKIIPSGFEFDEANSTPLFIESCTAESANPSNFKTRRVILNFFNSESWIIRFPDKDGPVEPIELPRLPPSDEEIKKQQEEEKKKAEKAQAESGGDPSGKPPEPEAKPEPPKPRYDPWTLSSRRGHEMPVSNVIPGPVVNPGGEGKCRYQYDGVIDDPETARIECHRGLRFLYFYAPIPCLKFIKNQ
jgi:hypothetical protein